MSNLELMWQQIEEIIAAEDAKHDGGDPCDHCYHGEVSGGPRCCKCGVPLAPLGPV